MSHKHTHTPPWPDKVVSSSYGMGLDLKSVNWEAGQPLSVWISEYTPIMTSEADMQDLIALIALFDQAQTESEKRKCLLAIYHASHEWLSLKAHQESAQYDFMLILHDTVKSRYRTICNDMITKAKAAIAYAENHIEHYQHDETSLKHRIAHLPVTISKKSREVLVSRLERFQKPIEMLQGIKEKNEAILLEIQESLTISTA